MLINKEQYDEERFLVMITSFSFLHVTLLFYGISGVIIKANNWK